MLTYLYYQQTQVEDTSIISVGVVAVLSFDVQVSFFDFTYMLELLDMFCLKFATKCSSGDGTEEEIGCLGMRLSCKLGMRSNMISSTLAAKWRISSNERFVTNDRPTKKCPSKSSPSSVCRRRPEIDATRHDVAMRQGETSRKDDSVDDTVMRSRLCLLTVLAIFFNRMSFVWGCNNWWVNNWFKIVYGVTAPRSHLSTLNAKSSHSYKQYKNTNYTS